MTGFPGNERNATWSPDGRLVAYARSANGPQDIFIMNAEDTAAPSVPLVQSTADDGTPRWSPDGRWVAFTSSRDDRMSVHLVPPEGGTPRRLVDAGWPPLDLDAFDGVLGEHPWSPDGRRLVYCRRRADGAGELVMLILETGEESVLTRPPPGVLDVDAAVSWDGRWLAWARHLPGTRSELWVRELDGSRDRLLVTESERLWSPSWSPDGTLLLYVLLDGSPPGIRSIPVAGGEAELVTMGPGFGGEVSISRGGRVMTSTFSHVTDLYLEPLEGGPARRLTAHPGNNFGAQVSPDGRSVAYMSSRTGDPDLWLLDLASGEERPLTEDPGIDVSPTWSPDGGRVAFVSDRGGRLAVWVVDAAGLRTRRLSQEDGAQPYFFANLRWSPDGRLIGFLHGAGGSLSLHVIDDEGNERGPIIEDVQGYGWYRDSNRVIYATGGTGDGRPAEMRVRHLETGQETVLLQRPHVEIAVSRDGSAGSYCRSSSHFDMNLEVLHLLAAEEPGGLPRPAGEPVAVTHGNGEWHVHNGGLSADGRIAVYTRDTDSSDLYELEGLFTSVP
jgi:Tol biopolymer transport system component